MSFAADARAEMARELCVQPCCARAELAAALLISGITYRYGGTSGAGSYSLSITTGEAAVARHYFQLLKKHFDTACQLRTLRGEALHSAARYQLAMPGEAARLLLERSGIWEETAPFGLRTAPPAEVTAYACCKKSLLKSAFMLGGVCSSPERDYHLEFDVPSEALATYIIDTLKYFEIYAKNTCRKGKYVVYLKKGDDVSDALTLMGATQATLALQGVRVKKEVRNRVNRQMNCDSSNINRATETALRQMEDIQFIESELGLEKLPDNLRAVAELRLNHAEASLAGLGELLVPPLSKSGVNARIRRLREIADALRSGEEIEL